MTFRLTLSTILCAFFFLNSTLYAQMTTDNGEMLERNLFKVVTEKDWATFESMLAPEVQSVNSDKIRNREELINYVKSIDFSKHDFSNFSITKDSTGSLQVVTYELTYKEKVGTEPESGKVIKNLSVWKKTNGKWQWVAHAVLDNS